MSWVAPDDGGSPITGYTVSVRESDGSSFSVDSENCDMQTSTATTCVIPVSVLRAAPYNLDWGTSVFAKVVAINFYGSSTESVEGNSGIIITTPDPPTTLAEVESQRTVSTIGISWVAPVFTGGAVIEDYRVTFVISGQSDPVIVSGVTEREYLATGLTSG